MTERGVNGEKWDAEWELRKAQNRYFDLMDEINKINRKIKSIEGKIYRIQQQLRGEEEEELGEEEERELRSLPKLVAPEPVWKRALDRYQELPDAEP